MQCPKTKGFFNFSTGSCMPSSITQRSPAQIIIHNRRIHIPLEIVDIILSYQIIPSTQVFRLRQLNSDWKRLVEASSFWTSGIEIEMPVNDEYQQLIGK